MKPITILINGALGKMGALAVLTLQQQPDFNVVATCGRQDDLARQLAQYQPDIALDLTVADVALRNLALIVDAGVRPVIGTSGLSEAKIAQVQKICQQEQLGGIIAPNFSISAILMMRFAKMAAKYFESAEIIELHHRRKVDAPSGTAIKTAELLAQAGNFKAFTDVSSARGEGHAGIAIHSVRMDGVLAKQQVLLGNPGEMLTLEANAMDRSAYMPGVLLCCRQVMNLTELVYGMDNLIA